MTSRPTYEFGAGFVVSRLAAGLLGRPPRAFAEEAQVALRRYRARVVVAGTEHLPARGPLIVASNHYQRPGMGAEWTAIAISAVVAERIPGADVRWMHTDGGNGYTLFNRFPVPPAIAERFLKWASARYGFLRVATHDVSVRAPMLREAYRLLHREHGLVGIMPEGGNARADGSMGASKPGAGRALSWLAASAVPVVPVAVHDAEDGTLVVAFGAPFVPPRRAADEAGRMQLTDAIMRRIASMLPTQLRGHYGEAARETKAAR
jgi:1-acyl-sn-glycerol-3-phosphate acyltransferase